MKVTRQSTLPCTRNAALLGLPIKTQIGWTPAPPHYQLIKSKITHTNKTNNQPQPLHPIFNLSFVFREF